MATRHAMRLVQRRLCFSGKTLSEEEKAVENVFIKGARAGGLGPIADAKQSESSSSLYDFLIGVGNVAFVGIVVALCTGGQLGSDGCCLPKRNK